MYGISLKTEYDNDPWLLAHKMNECYCACFYLKDCSACPFYDVFDTVCRSRSHCKAYLTENARLLFQKNLEEWCKTHPDRPLVLED